MLAIQEVFVLQIDFHLDLNSVIACLLVLFELLLVLFQVFVEQIAQIGQALLTVQKAFCSLGENLLLRLALVAHSLTQLFSLRALLGRLNDLFVGFCLFEETFDFVGLLARVRTTYKTFS